MKIKIFFIITFFLCFLVFSSVVANENIVQYEKVNPKQQIQYNIKRFKEKFTLFMCLSSKQKIKYSFKLIDARFNELIYIIENKDSSQIEKASQRYATTIGNLTELMLFNKDNYLKEEFIKKIQLHKEYLEKSKLIFSYDTSEYRFVMDDINSINIYLEKLLDN